MYNILQTRRFTGCLLIAGTLVAGCGEVSTPTGPPSPPPPPPPPVQGPSPVITAITPGVGSTGGGASIRIVGTNFRAGAFAMFDGVRVTGRLGSGFTTLFVETPPHAEGTVAIELRNSDGTSSTAPAGHSYVPPSSLNMNGAWGGYPGNGDDRWMSFTVENGRLVTASCYNDTFVEVSIPLEGGVSVSGGEFSLHAGERVVLSGRIVSDTEIMGRMDFDTCSPLWRAERLKSDTSVR